MRAQYEYGRGLMVFIPPTESELATEVVTFLIERVEERGNDSQQFVEILQSIAEDRRAIQ